MRRAVLLLLALVLGLCAPLLAAAQQDPKVLDRINNQIVQSTAPGSPWPWWAHRPTPILQYTFVAAGVSNRTWDVTMPTTPGSYEFGLLFINTYTVAARSPW